MDSAHNSASHSCAQLLLCSPGLWRHRNTQVEVISFWRRASFCHCASPDSPLLITAKKTSQPHGRLKELQWLLLWCRIPRPLWRNHVVHEAEQDSSTQQGSTCREQVIYNGLCVSPPETVILSRVEVPPSGSTAQTTLHQISIHNLTLKNQPRISFFPSKTQSVWWSTTQHWEISCRKTFLRASLPVSGWRDADLRLLEYKAVNFYENRVGYLSLSLNQRRRYSS